MASSQPNTSHPSNDGDGSRRNFAVEFAAVVIGGILAIFPLVVGLFAFFDPLRGRRARPGGANEQLAGPAGYTRIAALDALPENGTPQRFPVISDRQDAWNFVPNQPIGAVFVQRIGPEEVRVFNATCPHAGCSVTSNDTTFFCPCHNSSFNLDGTKMVSESGRENPSPRPLDQLNVDAEMLSKGEIWIECLNFYTGKEHKVPKA